MPRERGIQARSRVGRGPAAEVSGSRQRGGPQATGAGAARRGKWAETSLASLAGVRTGTRRSQRSGLDPPGNTRPCGAAGRAGTAASGPSTHSRAARVWTLNLRSDGRDGRRKNEWGVNGAYDCQLPFRGPAATEMGFCGTADGNHDTIRALPGFFPLPSHSRARHPVPPHPEAATANVPTPPARAPPASRGCPRAARPPSRRGRGNRRSRATAPPAAPAPRAP